MNIIGIVAEYNPFHTGHGYQMAESRTQLGEDSPVIAVMSGNWVQQAHCAIADKWTRARLALMGGADLVLELPTPFATASAETFGRGAVELLAATGLVTHLSFGSEQGQVDLLTAAAHALASPEYHARVTQLAESGLPFASCRQQAVEELFGPEIGGVLATPNNNLGVEYIKALQALGSSIIPMTVQRRGAAHNTIAHDAPPHLSATQIRACLREGDYTSPIPYLMDGGLDLLKNSPIPALKNVERAILLKLRTMTAEDWAMLPDSGAAEGLPQRMEKAGRQCRSVEEFYELVKTKRYTHARLRRLVLWAYLGLTADNRPEHPLYIRVLGFNERGQGLLKEMKKTAALPVITKPAHARKLEGQAREQFEREAYYTDLYDLCFDSIPASGREFTTDAVRLGGAENG